MQWSPATKVNDPNFLKNPIWAGFIEKKVIRGTDQV